VGELKALDISVGGVLEPESCDSDELSGVVLIVRGRWDGLLLLVDAAVVPNKYILLPYNPE
jgi:hypothetical protein